MNNDTLRRKQVAIRLRKTLSRVILDLAARYEDVPLTEHAWLRSERPPTRVPLRARMRT